MSWSGQRSTRSLKPSGSAGSYRPVARGRRGQNGGRNQTLPSALGLSPLPEEVQCDGERDEHEDGCKCARIVAECVDDEEEEHGSGRGPRSRSHGLTPMPLTCSARE